MPIVDRMEFPRRYKIKDLFVFIAVIAALFGIWLNEHGQKALSREIVISDVQVTEFGSNYIKADYTVQNLSKHSREIKLLAKIFDTAGQELASAMFIIEVPPSSKQVRTKVFDELTRPLKVGETPGKAEVRLYLRKVI